MGGGLKVFTEDLDGTNVQFSPRTKLLCGQESVLRLPRGLVYRAAETSLSAVCE